MRKQKIKTGFTLTELLTVIAIIVVLVAIGVPAAREVLESFESSAGVSNVIRFAPARRAIAARERRFAGVRFQQDTQGNQYMIFIVHDPANTGLVNGFRTAGGLDPIKLPRDVGVMDLKIVERTYTPGVGVETMDMPIDDDDLINELDEINETITFSIVFSPAGKLVTQQVQARNRDGIPDSTGQIGNDSVDEVFNKKDVVDAGDAMFYQDDYGFDAPWSHYPDYPGPGPEPSRNHFVIYDKKEFDSVDAESRWTDYLQYLEVVYVNQYTGQIINR